MKKKFVYIGLVLIAAAILVYSCSKGYNTPPSGYNPGTAGTGVMASVTIQNMAFIPDTLSIKTGTTVTWSNMDEVTHTVVELNGMFSSGNIAPGQTYSYSFPAAGTFTYHCTIHPMMKTGVVIVSN